MFLGALECTAVDSNWVGPCCAAIAEEFAGNAGVAAEGLGYSPLEVALAWVRDTPGITSAIVGARTGAQLRGVLKSEEIVLPKIVRDALDEISA